MRARAGERVDGCRQPASTRCTDATALDPSPTAAATRFIEPRRTSPAANTRGVDVSNGRGSRPRPCHCCERLHLDVGSGQQEAVGVAVERGEPGRRGLGADEAEQPPGVHLADAVDADALERGCAIEAGDARAGVDLDARLFAQTVDEVRRHAAAQVTAAHDEPHRASVGREVQRSLTRGVRPADHDDRRLPDLAQLELRRGVVDARALEVAPAIQVEPPVGRTGGHDGGAGADDAPVGECDAELIAELLERGGFARGIHAHAELERLQRGLPDEVAAGDAEGEPQEVLDARCRRCLPAGGHRIQQDGAEALGGAVDRGGEPGRSSAHHDEVDDLVGLRLVAQAQPLGDDARCRAQDRLALDVGDRQVLDRVVVSGDGCRLARVELDGLVHEIESFREAPEGEHVARVRRADEFERHGRRAFAKGFSTRPQRVQDDVGQLVVFGHQSAQIGARDPPDATVLRRTRRQERALPVQQAQLADEAPRTHVCENLLAHPAQGVANHFHLTRFDEDQVVVAVSGAEDVLTRRDVFGLAAECEQTRPLRVGQGRRLDRIVRCPTESG